MALQYLFDPNKQFQSIGGVNEVSGFLRVFLNGTDDRATTYKNFDGTLNEADIVLDSYGRAVVIVDDTKTYRIEVYNRLGGLMWTVSNYKARGGSGGGSGTPVSVEGKVGEIDVDENTEGGVKHFVVSLAATIKNAIATLTMAVNGVANALNGKKDRQTPVRVSGGTTKTIVGISQDSDGVITPEFDDIAFPDWTSAINEAVDTCEKLENKKTTLTGYESSNTYYPTIKAVVDFVNGMLQNLGGKLITDNGDPFTDSSDLPSYTPYGGVDIVDKDYAYVQGVGTAERWSATVSGSSVAWVQEYAISIPVFTPSQQAVIDGDSSDMTATFSTASARTNISTGEKLSVIFGKIAKWFGDLKAVAFSGSYNDLSDKPTIPTVNNGKLTISRNGTALGSFTANQSGLTGIDISVPTKTSQLVNDSFATVATSGSYNDLSDKPTIPTVNNGKLTISRNGTALGSFTANQSGLTGIDISVPTKTSQLVNDSFATVATSGSYNDLSNKPSIPSAANNGTLTITQNGTSKGTFTANQSGNVTISLTDTTYENKDAAEGSPDVSLVTAGDKFDWNLAYRQLFKLTKYVAGSEATQGTAIELGEFSWGPGYRLRFTISIEATSSDYTLGINIPFSTGVNQQWNGWLANTGNYDYCTKTEYRVGTSSPGFGVFGNNGTFPGVGQSRRIGDITIPRFSVGGVPVGMYRGKFLLSGYSDGLKSFVLDVDLCYKCANSGTTWWGYVSLLPNDMHA